MTRLRVVLLLLTSIFSAGNLQTVAAGSPNPKIAEEANLATENISQSDLSSPSEQDVTISVPKEVAKIFFGLEKKCFGSKHQIIKFLAGSLFSSAFCATAAHFLLPGVGWAAAAFGAISALWIMATRTLLASVIPLMGLPSQTFPKKEGACLKKRRRYIEARKMTSNVLVSISIFFAIFALGASGVAVAKSGSYLSAVVLSVLAAISGVIPYKISQPFHPHTPGKNLQ